jgi:hypothetical protein
MEELVSYALTTKPQSFAQLMAHIPRSPKTNQPYTSAPIRTALVRLHEKGKADYIDGRSPISNQPCKMWFSCEEVVDQPTPEATLYQVVMSRPWDLHVFEERV